MIVAEIYMEYVIAEKHDPNSNILVHKSAS